MSAANALAQYRKLLQSNSGADFMKVDLHVHTPASGDARWKSRYNFAFDRNDFSGSLKAARKIADEFVHRARDLGLRLVAITDHNTPSSVHPLEPGRTWFELLRNAASKLRDWDLCILPGVEISTDDLHVLVIFDPQGADLEGDGSEEPAAYTMHRINTLLWQCRFKIRDYGDFSATGGSSLFDVLKYAEDLGAGCIVIPAHIDGGNKAMLDVYGKPSNVFRRLLNHPNLNAVEVVKDTTPTGKTIGSGKSKRKLADYFQAQRAEDRSPLAWIQSSDGHSLHASGLGKRFTYVRMGKPSFSSLKNALEDPQTRVRLPRTMATPGPRTTILGLAHRRGSGRWSQVAFNPNLNCVVGAKGTLKSTLVDLLLYGLDRFSDSEKATREAPLQALKYSAQVFLAKGERVYCAERGAGGKPPDWFEIEGGSVSRLPAAPDLELPRRYNHDEINGRLSDKLRMIEFLDWRMLGEDRGLRSTLEKRNDLLDKVEARGFANCASDMKKLKKACAALYEKRKKLKGLDVRVGKKGEVTIAPDHYGTREHKPLFSVAVEQGKYIGTKRDDYFDRAILSILQDGRYRPLTRLRTAVSNAATIALLMNQGAFGPLIVDQPEEHLDVPAVTSVLIPRIRELKTHQQIICATSDEHILLSGDAEQVIVTQSEKRLEIVAGDASEREIQEQILEVFEGDRNGQELRRKNRKLAAILGG